VPQVALSQGTRCPSLTAVTTGTGTAYAVPPNMDHLNINVQGTGTITGGVITLEEAPAPDFTGTWSTITTVNAINVTGGAVQHVHVDGSFNAVRTRVSSNITGGGTVTTEICGGPN